MSATEAFWKGDFGDEYTQRNEGRVSANTALFAKVLARTQGIESIVEFGAGSGQNLQALRALLPEAELWGVEINESAATRIPNAHVLIGSMLDTEIQPMDLAFTKGLLIHIAPDDLPRAYARLFNSSKRYILVAEYFNPTPVEIEYRGHAGRLWKRDFAGDLMDRYPGLRLVDYGFSYNRGQFPQDSLTWFLMEKPGC